MAVLFRMQTQERQYANPSPHDPSTAPCVFLSERPAEGAIGLACANDAIAAAPQGCPSLSVERIEPADTSAAVS